MSPTCDLDILGSSLDQDLSHMTSLAVSWAVCSLHGQQKDKNSEK